MPCYKSRNSESQGVQETFLEKTSFEPVSEGKAGSLEGNSLLFPFQLEEGQGESLLARDQEVAMIKEELTELASQP